MTVFATVAIVCVVVAPASAQTGDPESHDRLSLHTSFDHYWRRYLQAAVAGDSETAERMLEEIKRLRVERNAFALNDVALSFV